MRVALGADHRGHTIARQIADRLRDAGHSVTIVGGESTEPCDYPERAYQVGRELIADHADRGILVCGTGIGMSIAANKLPGIRAALAVDEMTAQLSRSHNNANVLCLSADLLGSKIIERIVDLFMKTDFEGGRHARRVDKIHMIEAGQDPATGDVLPAASNR